MPSFKEMDPERIRAILDECDEHGEKLHRDVLTDLVEKDSSLFARQRCPKCKAQSCYGVIDARRPFSSGNPLPNRIARCAACGTEFDPYTRLITHATIIGEST